MNAMITMFSHKNKQKNKINLIYAMSICHSNTNKYMIVFKTPAVSTIGFLDNLRDKRVYMRIREIKLDFRSYFSMNKEKNKGTKVLYLIQT